MKKKKILSFQLGLWSSSICAGTFIIYAVCFLIILKVNPLFIWVDLSHYISYVNDYNQVFMYIAMFSMLLFGIGYMILLNSISAEVSPDKEILARISSLFGLVFLILISINYFIQITTVRLNIFQGNYTGLEQFVQGNPISASSAINMLGWTVFLGLSSLFMAPVFCGQRLEGFIRYSFLSNGCNMLVAIIGFLFQHTILTFITMFMGLGVTILCITISLRIFFKQKIQDRG